MSSYAVTPHKPTEHVCRVGYDSYADSFFIYVARPLITDARRKPVGDMDGHVIVWFGLMPGEITSVEELSSLLAPYAFLPKRLREILRDEQARGRKDAARAAAAARG